MTGNETHKPCPARNNTFGRGGTKDGALSLEAGGLYIVA